MALFHLIKEKIHHRDKEPGATAKTQTAPVNHHRRGPRIDSRAHVGRDTLHHESVSTDTGNPGHSLVSETTKDHKTGSKLEPANVGRSRSSSNASVSSSAVSSHSNRSNRSHSSTKPGTLTPKRGPLERKVSWENDDKHHLHRRRYHSVSAGTSKTSYLASPKSAAKIKYNPYGLMGAKPNLGIGTMLHGSKPAHIESQQLPFPTEDPNEYLPGPLKEKSQDLEDIYDANGSTQVGAGGAAQIRKVRIKGSHRTFYALKKFVVFPEESPQQYYRRIVEEYILTKNLRHLHTITCYELLKVPATMQRAWGMTMDYLPCDLMSQIEHSMWHSVPLSEKLCYFKQICFAIKYLHELDITHLDIKPDNILISGNGVLHLTDFGCCELGHEDPGNFRSPIKRRNKLLGTAPYQPPEVSMFRRLEFTDRPKYDPFLFDCWSLGVILFVLVTGRTPFLEAKAPDVNFMEYEKAQTRYSEMVPEFLQNDPNKCPITGKFAEPFPNKRVTRISWRLADPNYRTRMSLRQLFEDEFFQKIEMCIEEGKYECNFVHHKAAQGMTFEVPYGSKKELVHLRRPLRRFTSSSSTSGWSLLSDHHRRSSSTSLHSNHHYESMLNIGLNRQRHHSSPDSPKHKLKERSKSFDNVLTVRRNSSNASISSGESGHRHHIPRTMINVPHLREDVIMESSDSDISSQQWADRKLDSSGEQINRSKSSRSVNSESESIASHDSYSTDTSRSNSAVEIGQPAELKEEDESVGERIQQLDISTDDADEDEDDDDDDEDNDNTDSNAVQDDDDDEATIATMATTTTEDRIEANELNPPNKYEIVYPDGTISNPVFDEDDYGERSTIIPFDLVVKATQFELATHSHILR